MDSDKILNLSYSNVSLIDYVLLQRELTKPENDGLERQIETETGEEKMEI